MEIRERSIQKLLKVWNEKRGMIIREKSKGFTIYRTKEGGRIATTKIKNSTGWYALVCFFECSNIVEVYDMHVFDRYKERFQKEGEDPIAEFMMRGNADGLLLIKDSEGKTEKKICDGAVLGKKTGDIIYHKTFITDDMIRENKMDYLFELC